MKKENKWKKKFKVGLVNKIAGWPAVRSFNFDING